MEVALLGPLEIRVGGRIIPVTAPKERAVVSVLALRDGGVVTSRELIAALWGEEPPRSAAKALQTYVSNLRRILPENSIVTASGGYALVTDGVDTVHFDALAVTGRRRLAEGDNPAAVEVLREALGLWRGQGFTELTESPFGAPWATRLQELRRACEEDLVDARLAAGDERPPVAELEMAVAAEPLRERRWAQLMLALYRDGRQADALRTFERLRTLLAEEIGIDPSAELRALEAAILVQDPSLLQTPAAVRQVGGTGPQAMTTEAPVGRPDLPDPGRKDRSPIWPSDAHRDTAIVLFTDLVDSTEISHALHPDIADQFRRHHLSLLRETVRRCDGCLVKNLGDGGMAIFTSPSEALLCAAALQRAFQHLAPDLPVRPALRIGISAGEVATEEGDYFGDPVVEASRLCEKATGGQILVAAVVQTMAGRRAPLNLSAIGELELKGFDSPLTTLQLDWVSSPSEPPIPLPPPLNDVPFVGFFGRAREREVLSRAWQSIHDAQRRVAIVAGEPGIGKTTLTAVLARQVAQSGALVLYGRCDEELQLPYQPFVQAISHYVKYAPEGVLADHVSVHGGELSRLTPELPRRVPGCLAPTSTEPDAERYLTFAAVMGLIAAASRETPVLIVLDDLHWADHGTLLLFRFLATAQELSRVFLVGTLRSSEIAKAHDVQSLLASLRRDVETIRLDLVGLSDDEVVQLAETASGHLLDSTSIALARTIQRETNGNPFFVLEMIRHLAESGVIVRDNAGHWSASAARAAVDLPQSIREVVGQRVQRLGDEVERVLSIAAVVGYDFDMRLVGCVAGTDEGVLVELLEEAVAAALIVETPRVGKFVFAHALVQQTLYARLSAVRRRRIHRHVAEALEEQAEFYIDDYPRALAHHWGFTDDALKALRYARQAGAAAIGGLAPKEGALWFERALAIQTQHYPTDVRLRCDLLIDLGSAQRAAGDASYRQTLLGAGDLAYSMDDPNRMALAALAGYRGFWSSVGQVDGEKVAALETALNCMADVDSQERARILATLCNELTFSAPLARRRELADQAKAMSRRLGDPATTVDVLTAVFDPLWVPSTLAERLSDTDIALQLADRMGDPVTQFGAAGFRWRAAMGAGLFDEADRCLAQMHALSGEVRQPILLWVTTFARACRALLAGDPQVAEQLMIEAYLIGSEGGQPDALMFYGAGLSYVRWQQGHLDEILPLLEETAGANPAIPSYWGAVARALCEVGRAREASALLDAALSQRFAHLPEDCFQLPGLVMYADAAVCLDSAEAASVLLELLEPWKGQWSYMGVAIDGPVDHFLGGLASAVGDFASADEHFTRALTAEMGVGAKFFAARTQLEWARALSRRGRRANVSQARSLLNDAQSISRSEGYAVITRRTGAELSRLQPSRASSTDSR